MNNNPDNNLNEIVVALDIGTTKVAAVVGRRDEHGKVEILGTGKVESTGVMRGVVSNIEKTVNAIAEAVKLAENRSGVSIGVVNVGIAGQHIKSLQHRGVLMRDSLHDEISREDVERLINDMYKLVLPPGDKILHVIPQEFIVDNEQGITDPVGMSGIRLEANFHIVTGQVTASNNIRKCVEKYGLEVGSLTLEPIASAEAVLSAEEKEAGVVLVDIGGGTTDVAIFQDGIIRHTAVIPFGGNIITKDIKEGCAVMDKQAEALKVKFGCALANEIRENRIIAIPGLKGREAREISEVNLARIIQARVEEIFDHVFWEIRRSGYERKLVGGIVLTGGGAQLRHIADFAELHTGLATRIGLPTEILAHGYHEEVNTPTYATALGLLLKGIQEAEDMATRDVRPATSKGINFPNIGGFFTKNNTNNRTQEERTSRPAPEKQQQRTSGKPKGGLISGFFEKTKEWFEADPDKPLN